MTSNWRALLLLMVVTLALGGLIGGRIGYGIGKGRASTDIVTSPEHKYTIPSESDTQSGTMQPIAAAAQWHQTVHTVVPVATQTQPAPEIIRPTIGIHGELTFDIGGDKLTFDPKRPEQARVEHTTRCFAAFVTLETAKKVTSKLTETRLFRIDCDAEAGAAIDPINEVANVTWEVRTLAPVHQSERAVAIEQSVGLGAAFGGWRDVDLCATYSPFRLGRLRLPSAVADTGGHVGAGIQARIWRPFHAGAFCAWDLTDDFSRSLRLTATANF